MNMKCSRVFKKALPLALLSATFAVVACDFGSESKDSSEEQPVAPESTVEEGSDQPTKTEPVDDDPVAERGSSSSVQSVNGSSSSVQSSTPSAFKDDHCFEDWGPYGVARINTGYDAGFNNSGYWYTYNDNEDGGKSTIKWAAEPDVYGGLEPVLEKCVTGLCGTYKLDKGTLDYDPYVVVAFDLAGKDADGRVIPVDASGLGGFEISLAVSAAATLELSMGNEEDAKIDFALPAYDLGTSTVGKSVRIPWTKFAQPSWAKNQISTEEVVKKLASVRIRIQAKDGNNGEFNIMKIVPVNRSTFKNCPDYVPPVSSSSIVPKSSSSVVPPSSSSVVPKSSNSLATCDFETWNGADGLARINTGCDAGFNNSGYWYTYNDSLDGGKSIITWAAEPDEEYGGLEPVLEACGNGMCGTYKLDKGDLVYDPYVAVGFDLAGKGADGRVIPVDASGMGGIAITLSVTHAAVLELSLGDEMDKKIGYALPAYDMGKSATGKTVDIPWSKFAQPSWAKDDQLISMDEAVKSIASIRVKVQAKSGSTGEFNIMQVGEHGHFVCCGPGY